MVLLALLSAVGASACQLTDGIGPTFTPTHTAEPEDTPTPIPERPPAPTPTATLTPIPTATSTAEIEHPLLIDTFTPTATPTFTVTPTFTPTSTPTPTPEPTHTPEPTSTTVPTPQPTATPPPTATPEPTFTPTPTATETPTALEVSTTLLAEVGICNAPAPPVGFVARPDFPERDWAPPPAWRVEAAATHDTVEIEWDILDDSEVQGYRVFRWQVCTSEIEVVDRDATVTSFLDTDGIYPETEYRYWVFPIKSGTLGHPSDPVDVSTPASVLPTTPVDVYAVISPNSVGLNWAPPKNETIETFTVLRRDFTSASQWLAITSDIPSTSRYEPRLTKGFNYIDEADLVPGTEYHYAVCSNGPAGVGEPSEIIAVPVPETLEIPAPENVRAEATYRIITVKWDPVEHSTISGYDILRRIAKSDYLYRVVKRTGSRLTTAVVESHIDQPLMEYEYKVRAVTPLWKGRDSEPITVTTDAAPSAHSELPPVPINLTARATHNYVFLQWDPVADPMVMSYRVFRKEIGVDEQYQVHETWNWFDVDSEHYELDFTEVEGTVWNDVFEVKPETMYEYRIAAVNQNGDSEMSEPVQITTEAVNTRKRQSPVTPFNLKGEQTEHGVKLSWAAPDDPTITEFEIEQVHADLDLVTRFNHEVAGQITSFVVPDLQADEYYSFQVRALNEVGFGHQSQRVRIQAPEVAPELQPLRPHLAFTVRKPESAYLNLRNLYHEDMWRYRVTRKEYTIDGFTTEESTWESDQTEQGHRVEDFPPSTLYFYEFKATNGDFESNSLYAIGITPNVRKPDRPANVFAGADHNEVNLEWSPTDDTSITHYHFKRFSSHDGRQMDEFVIEAPDNSYSDTDVRADADYWYSTSAVNSAGHSARTHTSSHEPKSNPAAHRNRPI